jgi:hypothetical protein
MSIFFNSIHISQEAWSNLIEILRKSHNLNLRFEIQIVQIRLVDAQGGRGGCVYFTRRDHC